MKLSGISAKKKAAEQFLQGVGGKIAGRSVVNNTTDPYSGINRQRSTVASTEATNKFRTYVKKVGKVK